MRRYKRPLSIKFKLIVIFLIVILANLCANLFYRQEVKKLIHFYEVSQSEYYRINKISVSFKNAKAKLEEYYTSGIERSIGEYQKNKEEVFTLIGQLTSQSNNPDEWYMIHAMTNASEVFFERCDDAIDKKRHMEAYSYLDYYQAGHILEYINGYTNEYLNIMLENDGKEYARLEKNASDMEKMTQLFLVCSAIVSILGAINLSETVTRPIRKLVGFSRKISKGDFDIEDAEVISRDEVGELTIVFNHMKDNIKRLVEDLNKKSQLETQLHQEELKNLKMDELLKEAQLLALQSQINPHFLFNTLNAISRSAEYGDAQVTTALIRNLADLFRYSLDHFNSLSTIGDEVAVVGKYIFIQKQRFGDRIRYSVRGMEGCESVKIPSMTLQPLVENAIIHGIENLEFGGLILIDIKMKVSCVQIRVYDSGEGLERNRLREIKKGKTDRFTGHTTGIGLSNIITRIQLYQGGRFQLYSSPRYGTIAQIRFPIILEDINEL